MKAHEIVFEVKEINEFVHFQTEWRPMLVLFFYSFGNQRIWVVMICFSIVDVKFLSLPCMMG